MIESLKSYIIITTQYHIKRMYSGPDIVPYEEMK